MKAVILFFILCSFSVFFFSSCSGGLFGFSSRGQYSLIPTNIEEIPYQDYFFVNISSAYFHGDEAQFNPLDAIIYAMDEGPGTACKIPVDADSTEDLYCVMDVMEGDLMHHSIELEYNFPPGMCEYAGFIVPYHLNQATAKGPEVVSSCKFGTGKINEETNQEEVEDRYCVGSCKIGACLNQDNKEVTLQPGCNTEEQCKDSDNNCGNIVGTWETTVCKDKDDQDVTSQSECNSKEKCEDISNNCGSSSKSGKWETGRCKDRYNRDVFSNNCDTLAKCEDNSNQCGGNNTEGKWETYSGYECQYGGPGYKEIKDICGLYDLSEAGLGNCCFGDYIVSNGQRGQWGGNFKECIGGPGRFAWEVHNQIGRPVTGITQVFKKGLKEQYTLPAIESVHDGRYTNKNNDDKRFPSFITSNHYKDVENKNYESIKNNLKVYVPETPPSPFLKDDKEGNPFFVWTCIDKAEEIKHRIFLLIREWNTQAEYNSFKETSGSKGDPDIARDGDEGSDCDYYTSESKKGLYPDTDCNDFLDLDDWQDVNQTYPYIIYKE